MNKKLLMEGVAQCGACNTNDDCDLCNLESYFEQDWRCVNGHCYR